MPQLIFITGMYRSGTTLLDKLLHCHPDVAVASQPAAQLFLIPKREFLHGRGLDRAYPLGHLFLEADYRPCQFHEFLANFRFRCVDWEHICRGLSFNCAEVDQRFDGDDVGLVQAMASVYKAAASAAGKQATPYVGAKEIVCEEFLGFLLGSGVHVVVILRDPRDVLASCNLGQGKAFMGGIRPTLYVLRTWRKSVALTLAHQAHPNLTVIRYEDLVADPAKALERTLHRLHARPFPEPPCVETLVDQQGDPWQSNTSFPGAKDALPPSARTFVEQICAPEMLQLGYLQPAQITVDERLILGFREPFVIDHDSFPADYSEAPQRLQEEVTRIRLLLEQHSLDEQQVEAWFLAQQAYDLLRPAFLNGAC